MGYNTCMGKKDTAKRIGIFLSFFIFLFTAQIVHADYLANWTLRTPQTANSLFGITYGNGTFIAVGEAGTILTSPDGVDWTSQSSGTNENLSGITLGNSTFIAVGDAGIILTSPDGVDWTSQSSGTNDKLYGITYGNNLFVATGLLGGIFTSPDGDVWTSQESDTDQTISAVAFGNHTFVAVGFSFYVLTSPNGETWSTHNPDLGTDFNSITYGNGLFAAVGFKGGIFTTPNGITWTKRTSGTSKVLHGSTYGNKTFVAAGINGTILSSRNGQIWTARSSGITEDLHGTVFGNGTFVAVGTSGTILQSDADVPPVILVSLNAGEQVSAGSTYNVTWQPAPSASTFNLSYSLDNGVTWAPVKAAPGITSATGNGNSLTGSFTGTSVNWAVPLLTKNKTKCLMKITAFDVSNKKLGTDKSDGPFTIEVLSVTTPSSCTSGQVCRIEWTKAPAVNATTAELSYSLDNGTTWKKILAPISGTDTGYDWTPTVTKTKTKCKVKVVLKDASGKKVGSDASDGVFTINP